MRRWVDYDQTPFPNHLLLLKLGEVKDNLYIKLIQGSTFLTEEFYTFYLSIHRIFFLFSMSTRILVDFLSPPSHYPLHCHCLSRISKARHTSKVFEFINSCAFHLDSVAATSRRDHFLLSFMRKGGLEALSWTKTIYHGSNKTGSELMFYSFPALYPSYQLVVWE